MFPVLLEPEIFQLGNPLVLISTDPLNHMQNKLRLKIC